MSIPKTDNTQDYASFKNDLGPSMSDIGTDSAQVTKVTVKKNKRIKKQLTGDDIKLTPAQIRGMYRIQIKARNTDPDNPLTPQAKLKYVEFLRQFDKTDSTRTTIKERAAADSLWWDTGYQIGER
jgi:hypothetical protein